MNTFLTTHMAVDGPLLVHAVEGARMADSTPTWPCWYFPAGGPPEPDYGGRCFESQAELDAAGSEGPWFQTPTEAAASVRAPLPPPPPPPDEGGVDMGSTPPPRRR